MSIKKFDLLDTICLIQDIFAADVFLYKGTIGVIVHIYNLPYEVYEVEFLDVSDDIFTISLKLEQMEIKYKFSLINDSK